MVRPDDPVAQVFDADRIADHRVVYLTKEGDLGDGRGAVARIASGWCTIARLDDDGADLSFDLGRGVRRIVGKRTGRAPGPGTSPDAGVEWRFAVKPGAGR